MNPLDEKSAVILSAFSAYFAGRRVRWNALTPPSEWSRQWGCETSDDAPEVAVCCGDFGAPTGDTVVWVSDAGAAVPEGWRVIEHLLLWRDTTGNASSMAEDRPAHDGALLSGFKDREWWLDSECQSPEGAVFVLRRADA